MIQIEGQFRGQMDVKRFKMHGVDIHVDCPNCNKKRVQQFDYLSYPRMNENFELDLYCDECLHEWKQTVFLAVELLLIKG